VKLIENNIQQDYWITILLVGCFVFLAVLKSFFKNSFSRWITGATPTDFAIKNYRDTIIFSWSLMIFQGVVFSILFFLVSKYTAFKFNFELNYLKLCVIFTSYLLGRWLIERGLALFFPIADYIIPYQVKFNFSRGLLALLLYIVICFMYFNSASSNSWLLLFYVFLGVYLVLVIFSYISYKRFILDNFFYFILYLCALEILPFIVLYYLYIK
jgi:hypothetical protein